MAQTRAEREAAFKAEHGVSSGTYYSMRRNAESRGISPKTFDAVYRADGYQAAKGVAQMAATDLDHARFTAAAALGAFEGVTWSDFDDSFDIDFPADYEWWYH